jgi:hypothetical protein
LLDKRGRETDEQAESQLDDLPGLARDKGTRGNNVGALTFQAGRASIINAHKMTWRFLSIFTRCSVPWITNACNCACNELRFLSSWMILRDGRKGVKGRTTASWILPSKPHCGVTEWMRICFSGFSGSVFEYDLIVRMCFNYFKQYTLSHPQLGSGQAKPSSTCRLHHTQATRSCCVSSVNQSCQK